MVSSALIASHHVIGSLHALASGRCSDDIAADLCYFTFTPTTDE